MRPLAAALALMIAATVQAQAAPRHGLSVFGDLKYPEGFAHFDYVNPQAPKGGKISLIGPAALDTFDSFNAYILKGDAAQGTELLFDSLMARATDEPDAVYGLVAKTADLAEDRSSLSFVLRPEAKFADGTALTADDVCDSFRLLSTKAVETVRLSLRDVASCTVAAPGRVRYDLKPNASRDAAVTIATLPIFSKAYYAKVDFEKSSLDPPLGSGPYRVKSFKPGEYVTYGRRPDYWAKDLPVNAGRYNFDEIRFDYFRDRIASLEALKSGVIDLREEYISRDWATAYDFPAVKEGRILRLDLPDETPSGAQGFFLNLRRAKFQDIRVRKALNLAFDFEWTNANLFHGLYTRTQSFFENSPLKAEGAPSPAETAILEPLRKDVSPEVFGPPQLAPVSDGSGQDRTHLHEASELLDQAGWKIDNGQRRNAKGETLAVEFLLDNPVFERVLTPYLRNLQLLGIDATMRTIDDAQYQLRLKTFDFDIVSTRFASSVTPGSELRSFFGSAAAKADGSYNLSGLSDPVVDRLIENVLTAPTRDQLDAAGRALDRVLRAEWFWVPNWYKPSFWIACWDKYGRPDVKPKYDRGIVDTWWFDAAKAERLAKGN
jgi:microcin C transport system substrate-binding protein